MNVDDFIFDHTRLPSQRDSDLALGLGATTLGQSADRRQRLCLVVRVAFGAHQLPHRDRAAVDLQEHLLCPFAHTHSVHDFIDAFGAPLCQVGDRVVSHRVSPPLHKRPIQLVTVLLQHLLRRCAEAHLRRQRRQRAVEPRRRRTRLQTQPLTNGTAVGAARSTAVAPDLDLQRASRRPHTHRLPLALASQAAHLTPAGRRRRRLIQTLEHRVEEPLLQHPEALIHQRLDPVQPLDRR